MDESARGAVLQATRDYTPADLGQNGVMWTRASVRTLIRLVCGVSMTERGVGKWLRRHGFTPQRPARRSYRQKDDEVSRWPAGRVSGDPGPGERGEGRAGLSRSVRSAAARIQPRTESRRAGERRSEAPRPRGPGHLS
ncbi:winged helix-turn-helix domain-containing protein [Streptomyces hirsutus]|uniref:winged helix-turn-helix domain-containing protein n=1 Tax=Streptomyces hirsutus TaxID=35620 RepID=UPI003412EB8C